MTATLPSDALPRQPTSPATLTLAADARLSRTSYTDDHAWQLTAGAGDAPALVLQTCYGGRVGLASLLPFWIIDGRPISEAIAYATPPRIVAFAPGFAVVEAEIVAGVALTAEVWVMESQAVGMRYTLRNRTPREVALRCEVFGQVGAGGKALRLAVLSLAGGGNALSLGRLKGIEPVIVMENGGAELIAGARTSPKIGADLHIPAGGQVSVRWAQAALSSMARSLTLALAWLEADWDSHIRQIVNAAQAIPHIDTSDPDRDLTLALSYHQLVQAFLKPTGALPYPSYVARRNKTSGHSPKGDGTDHERSWSGQTAYLTYLVALGVASIAPDYAKGLLLNYLAIMDKDYSIDARPGLAGQRAGYNVQPVLARLAWRIFRYTGDEDFLRKALPRLLKYYRYWFNLDPDHLPQWASEAQMGYGSFPTFGAGKAWAQNADIRTFESPDMAAYLLAEGICLEKIARIVGDPLQGSDLQRRIATARIALDDLWRKDRYTYRDNQTRKREKPVVLLAQARADEEHFIRASPPRPARLIVRISGGTNKTPALALHIDGVDASGEPVSERVEPPAVAWYRGYGVYTTRHVYQQVDRVQATGLSRVYRLDVTTVDHSREDINALLPLSSMGITLERAEQLVARCTDPDRFWRPNGVSMVAATDPSHDPSGQNGGGGVWLYWLTLIGEGLCDYGYTDHARDLVERILAAQTALLRIDGHFHEFYDSDALKGWGEGGHLAGIAPLHLLTRVLSVRILSAGRVWTGDPVVWRTPYTVRQHGVTVERSAAGTTIRFPSGHVVSLPPDAPWQLVTDPAHAPFSPLDAAPTPELPPTEDPYTGRVLIQVDTGEAVQSQTMHNGETDA